MGRGYVGAPRIEHRIRAIADEISGDGKASRRGDWQAAERKTHE
jgi:hypothetical protein